MYLPVNAVITATGFLAASNLGISNPATNDLSLSTASAVLVACQDDTEPPPLVTSIQFITSIAFITSEPTPTLTATPPKPDISSVATAPPPNPSTIVGTLTSSEQPPTKASTTALAPSTSSTTQSTSSLTFARTSTTTATTTPTQTSHADIDADPWLSRGKIAGIVVGSVFGLVILGLIIYTLFAASRGINVCDCFGGCCGKHDDKDEESSRDRLPSRSEDTHPHPDVLKPGPGGGYRAYRPAHPVNDHPSLPLPPVLPRQAETQQRRAVRLQKG
ncbi:uncharacterized protein ALTATR162_LOCUS2947 [Alternaria atra]|uniref:Mid2 domain-containing protein n=1 Tax=Alternaria atra TaxID=119953 RepID=A0A8J2HZD6_9PLEO|nr:uncharacterized protein ALTATR162_LOCUS2947 [Alternaria atra]CAG5152879.1 unnamed protein product [Alternaria atra]